MAEHRVPLIGGTYRHYKGGLYAVVAVAQLEGTKLRYVVYRGADGHVWVRPLDQWFAKVHPNTGDRTPVERFTYEVQHLAPSGGT